MNLSRFFFISICSYVPYSKSFHYCKEDSKKGFIKDFLERAEHKLEPTLIDKVVIAVVDMEREHRRHVNKTLIKSCCLKIVGDVNELLCLDLDKELYNCLYDTVYRFSELIENATLGVDDSLLETCHYLIKGDSNRGRKRQDILQRGMQRKTYARPNKKREKYMNLHHPIQEVVALHSLSTRVLPISSPGKEAKRIRYGTHVASSIPYSSSEVISLNSLAALHKSKLPRMVINKFSQPAIYAHPDLSTSFIPYPSISISTSSIPKTSHIGGFTSSFTPVSFPHSSFTHHLALEKFIQPSTLTTTIESQKALPTTIYPSHFPPSVFTSTGFIHPQSYMQTATMTRAPIQDITPKTTSSNVLLQSLPRDIYSLYSSTQNIPSAYFPLKSKIASSKIAAQESEVFGNPGVGILKEMATKHVSSDKESE